MTRPFPRRAIAGFSIIVTLFVIVVLAAVAAFAVGIRTAQQQTVDFGLLNARAQAAAAAGIQWGANQALHQVVPVCMPSNTIVLAATGLKGFSVTITCSASPHTVNGTVYQAYLLTATAQNGQYVFPPPSNKRNPDFVQATQTLSVNKAPIP